MLYIFFNSFHIRNSKIIEFQEYEETLGGHLTQASTFQQGNVQTIQKGFIFKSRLCDERAGDGIMDNNRRLE